MIVQLEDAKFKNNALKADVKELRDALRIDELLEKSAELEKVTCEGDFWNREDAQTVLSELNSMKAVIADYTALEGGVDGLAEVIEMAIDADDESFTGEVVGELERLTKNYDKQRIQALLSGEFDTKNAILSIHPGAGGTEAQDWASMLYRMYCRYGEKHGFKVKLLDYLDGEEAGIKSATILISGQYAYGYLKSEGGVHRLVRVSPFDASGRRHTSFASVEVMPELDDDAGIEIRDEDIEMETHRASGAGGQHINKTDSAVRIIHKPTGIVVGCQTERSQLQNRETCLKMLKAKLLELKERERAEKLGDITGEKLNIEWGSQIRSYVFMPYTLAKDTRTGYEDGNIQAVMDGELDGFINAYLKAKGNFLK